MLTALPEIVDLKTLLFLDNHEDCPKCQKEGWRPSPSGRHHKHRHDKLTLRVTQHLAVILRDYCKRFKVDNDGLIRLILRGLVAEGVLPGSSPLVAESQQTHDQEHTTLEAKEVVAESQQLHDTAPQTTKAYEESPTLELEKGPDLWAPIVEPLKERVTEQNFETWLSSLRFVSSIEPNLVLACPNTFFQEYLTKHYTEVIQEELQKAGHTREVLFELGQQTTAEATQEPAKETQPQATEAPVLPPLSPKEEIRIRRRLMAREEATSRKSGLNHKLLVSLLNVIEAAEAKEDQLEAEQEKAARREALRDQWAKPSSWWSDDKVTNKKLRQLAAQAQRDNKKGTHQPKRE
jgi:DnaA N-terminal domain